MNSAETDHIRLLARKSAKRYFLANREKCTNAVKKWRHQNSEEINSKRRIYDSKKRTELTTYKRQWRTSEKGISSVANMNHRRRARLRNATSNVKTSDILLLRNNALGICSYCRQHFDKLTIDHIIPLALGGHHSIENLTMACRSCNSSKGYRHTHPISYVGQ